MGKIIEVKSEIVFGVMTQQLVWYGHVNGRKAAKENSWLGSFWEETKGTRSERMATRRFNEMNECQCPGGLAVILMWILWRQGVAE